MTRPPSHEPFAADTESAPTHAVAPELLAPAGDWECAAAAVENGADAIYFGLDCGFNARARAKNFDLQDLPRLMETLHRRGVSGYVTLNTLAFASELPALEDVIGRIAAAGVDAVLVQDLGVARLVHSICPQLDIHASTQMTMTSAETIREAGRLGVRRVVLAREMSIAEIRKCRDAVDMPLEVFVHGALCVAYSGQCLTSESLGGRSANRGQCAQACRLPYDLVCDGQDRDLGDVRYLLSPQDLAAYALVPELIEAGVCSLKIEGRLKTPEYVANITTHYRQAIDQAVNQRRVHFSKQQVREMELSFSRGFSPGWLGGCDHKMLVPGIDSAKRGVAIGEVLDVMGHRVVVRLTGPVARGDGLAFSGDRISGSQQGGRVFDLQQRGRKLSGHASDGDVVEIVFGRGDIDASQLYAGQTVWKTDDPQLNKRLRQSFSGQDPRRRLPLDMTVHAVVGQPLRIAATSDRGTRAEAVSPDPLQQATKHPVSDDVLRSQLGRLGGTPWELRRLTAHVQGEPMVPVSVLNALRRQLVQSLDSAVTAVPPRTVRSGALDELRSTIQTAADASTPPQAAPALRVLCRDVQQIAAAADAGIQQVYVDFHDIRLYRQAIGVARQRGIEIFLASVRIQKPGEQGLLRVLLRHQPDGILARNLAALRYFADAGLRTVADFSLNAANDLTVDWLRHSGAERVTASYDLNRDQLLDLVQAVPPHWLEVVIHQHMPMFHMEHCVFCSVLSPGTNKTNCGRPCDSHIVQLRDRIGTEHPLQADVACRNTLYNAVPQSAAEAVPELLRRGVHSYRIELLQQDASQTREVIVAYQQLLAGQLTGDQVWRQLQAANRVGVTRGTLEQRRNPLAII